MEKKMTQKDMYNKIITLCEDEPDVVEFCQSRIDLLDRKKNSTNSAKAAMTDTFKEIIYNAIAESVTPITASELIAKYGFEELKNEAGVVSTQRVSAYANMLENEKRIEKVKIKKKTYYQLATAKEEE